MDPQQPMASAPAAGLAGVMTGTNADSRVNVNLDTGTYADRTLVEQGKNLSGLASATKSLSSLDRPEIQDPKDDIFTTLFPGEATYHHLYGAKYAERVETIFAGKLAADDVINQRWQKVSDIWEKGEVLQAKSNVVWSVLGFVVVLVITLIMIQSSLKATSSVSFSSWLLVGLSTVALAWTIHRIYQWKVTAPGIAKARRAEFDNKLAQKLTADSYGALISEMSQADIAPVVPVGQRVAKAAFSPLGFLAAIILLGSVKSIVVAAKK